MEASTVKCPNCDSDNVNFIGDNLDDIFAADDHFLGKVPFFYGRNFECLDCGTYLSEEFRFDITGIGISEIEW